MKTELLGVLVVVSAAYAVPRIESTPKVLPYEEARATYGADDESTVDYVDHHLFVAAVENDHQREELEKLQQERNELDFWNPVFVSRNVSIRAPPASVGDVEKQLKKLHLSYTVATKDLQSWIQHEKEENKQQNLFLVGSDPSRFSLNQYHSYDEISAYLDAVANRHSDIAKLNFLGTTYEGRQIKGKQSVFNYSTATICTETIPQFISLVLSSIHTIAIIHSLTLLQLTFSFTLFTNERSRRKMKAHKLRG